MARAYDTLEWDFLEEVLASLGFHDKFISLVKECVSSVYYSILLNGSPFWNFSPPCRIRQGDPLSSYLFIMAAEVLSRLLTKAKDKGRINGIGVCRRALVSHT